MIKKFSDKKPDNSFVYFILKLGVFFIFLLCIDSVFGSIIRYYYFKQKSGLEFATTYSIEKTTANILIFGSSRANHHYNPAIFESQLKMSCQNVGRDGQEIFYHFAVLKAVLHRYSPKIIILDFNWEEFIKDQVSYDKISSLLPYYRNHPEIHRIVNLKSNYEKIKLFFKSYPYNSTIFYVILGNTEYNLKKRNEINGYVPLYQIWNKPVNTYNELKKYELDTTKIEIYEAFIKDCINSGIELYIIHSPYFARSNYLDKSIEIGQVIAKKHNVPFYDFTNDSVFINNQILFSEPAHLNDKGAKIFSNMIINKIWQPN